MLVEELQQAAGGSLTSVNLHVHHNYIYMSFPGAVFVTNVNSEIAVYR